MPPKARIVASSSSGKKRPRLRTTDKRRRQRGLSSCRVEKDAVTVPRYHIAVAKRTQQMRKCRSLCPGSGGRLQKPRRVEIAQHRASPVRVGLLVESVAELGRAVQPLGVPADMLAGDRDAGLGAVQLEHRLILPGEDGKLRVHVRIGQALAGG